MNLRALPAHVRATLYVYWVGMAAAGLGIVGFFLSFWRVGSPAQAAIDVHREVPVVAYLSIFAWVGGLLVMWLARKRIDAATASRLQERRDASFSGAAESPGADAGAVARDDGITADASVGRET